MAEGLGVVASEVRGESLQGRARCPALHALHRPHPDLIAHGVGVVQSSCARGGHVM